YGTETEKLQRQLASEKGGHTQFPAEDCGGRPHLHHEVAKSLCQHSPMPVTHYAYSMPLEALPSFQETLAEELRTSLRRIISDPEYFVERRDLHYREEREPEPGVMPPPEDLMPPEELEPPEELVPEEELGAMEEVGTAEEGLEEEAEVASEETE
uniref:Huntingtin-associated protein 1 n=1 Tax=Jaculus jaculus TaxID=51337 RepID=A0A8C5P4P3_JACJA